MTELAIVTGWFDHFIKNTDIPEDRRVYFLNEVLQKLMRAIMKRKYRKEEDALRANELLKKIVELLASNLCAGDFEVSFFIFFTKKEIEGLDGSISSVQTRSFSGPSNSSTSNPCLSSFNSFFNGFAYYFLKNDQRPLLACIFCYFFFIANRSNAVRAT